MAEDEQVILKALYQSGDTPVRNGEYGLHGNRAYERFVSNANIIVARCAAGVSDDNKRDFLATSYQREVASATKELKHSPELDQIKAALKEAYNDLRNNLPNCTPQPLPVTDIRYDPAKGGFYAAEPAKPAASKPAAAR